MAQVHALAIARDITTAETPITPGTPPSVTLVINLALYPADGSPGITTGIPVTQPGNATAATWKQAFIDAIKAFAAAPVSSPDTYIIDRLIGLIDIATLANP